MGRHTNGGSRTRGTRSWVIMLAFASAASCDDVRSVPTGTYFLAEADGAALPVSWTVAGQEFRLLADTLEFMSERRFRRSRALEYRASPSAPTELHRDTAEGTVGVDGGAWRLNYDVCGPESLALCVPSPEVRTRGGLLEVFESASAFSVLTFVRAGGVDAF